MKSTNIFKHRLDTHGLIRNLNVKGILTLPELEAEV